MDAKDFAEPVPDKKANYKSAVLYEYVIKVRAIVNLSLFSVYC